MQFILQWKSAWQFIKRLSFHTELGWLITKNYIIQNRMFSFTELFSHLLSSLSRQLTKCTSSNLVGFFCQQKLWFALSYPLQSDLKRDVIHHKLTIKTCTDIYEMLAPWCTVMMINWSFIDNFLFHQPRLVC